MADWVEQARDALQLAPALRGTTSAINIDRLVVDLQKTLNEAEKSLASMKAHTTAVDERLEQVSIRTQSAEEKALSEEIKRESIEQGVAQVTDILDEAEATAAETLNRKSSLRPQELGRER